MKNKDNVTSFVVGFIFSLGLGVSGMTQPQKVFGFLDVFGNWDPTLMFVMIGSIAVHFVTYKIIRKRNSPLFSSQWHVSENTKITLPLILGSIIFGFGWGLGGYCPGPAVTSLASFQGRPMTFVVSMLIGMVIFTRLDKVFKFNR